jgi:Cys-rich four helix bundle protein (predicted Tat secretion target)
MDRREALGTLVAASVAALGAGSAIAEEHAHHHHHAGLKYQALADSAQNCLATGEACLNHCFELLGQGDKEMAACAKSVNQMTAMVETLRKLAIAESRFLPRYAALCAEVCEDCEKECRKHENKHAECKACANACAACLKECKAISA